MEDSTVRTTDTRLNKEGVFLSGSRMEHVTEMIAKVMSHGKGVSMVMHTRTKHAEREGQ